MRDHIDNNGIWAETVQFRKAIVLDMDFQILDPAFRATRASPNLSQFLQKLEHWTGENAETLHDHEAVETGD